MKDKKCGGFFDNKGTGTDFISCTKPVDEKDSNQGSILYIKSGKSNILQCPIDFKLISHTTS